MSLSNSPYPATEEFIHGVLVTDPYRWLEDRRLPETEEWIINQQRDCDSYFARCNKLDVLRGRVRENLDVEVIEDPASVAGRYFYRRRNQGQEQACIYVRDANTAKERLLVDPSAMGPFVSVGIHSISQDGSLLAYGLKHGGGDRKTVHVVDVASARTLSEFLPLGYARGFFFAQNCKSFYYCHEQLETAEDHMVRLHRLGETGKDDEICFKVKRSRGSRLILTADEVHLGAVVMHHADGALLADFWIADRSKPKNWSCIFAKRSLPFIPFLKQGRVFAISSNEAPNGKFVELNSLGIEIRTIVPERPATIRQVVLAGERVFINYIDRMAHAIHCWNLTGRHLGKVPTPEGGTVQIVRHFGNAEDSIFYTFESFAQPPSILEHRIDSMELHYWYRSNAKTESSRVTCQETYSSKDGTTIPVTLVAEQGRTRNGQLPALMTSYGGFGVSMTPRFSVLASIMMELGCTLVLPHIRGGGELGKYWHESARGRNRQVAFDDFIAASEWLCEKRITAPEQVAIFGGSNSGLLVAAVMVQRPDLFRAVLCVAPLLDMVRYESFDQAARWQHEYGSVVDPEDFAALHSYSPYHHVEEDMNYPAVLFVSGDKDDRCNPAHVRKMAKRLQDRSSQRAPILVDYSEERGHAAVMPLSVRIEALAKRIAFLCNELNIPISFGGSDEKACV